MSVSLVSKTQITLGLCQLVYTRIRRNQPIDDDVFRVSSAKNVMSTKAG